jgi:hypothetical protein
LLFLGKLAAHGGLNSRELVESELTRCLAWIQHEKNENCKHGAALVIREFLKAVPNMMASFISAIIDCVWIIIFEYRVRLIHDVAISGLYFIVIVEPSSDWR